MPYYRIYSLDRMANHIIDLVEMEADCDSTAILRVVADTLGVSRELWNEGRKVADIPAHESAPTEGEAGAGVLNLIETGGPWRWDPLAAHCQLVAYGLGRRSELDQEGCSPSHRVTRRRSNWN